MVEPETIYTSILTASYNEEEETAETAIQYSAELPIWPSENIIDGFYPLLPLAAELYSKGKPTAFKAYADHPDLSVDEIYEEIIEEQDIDAVHWMTWLENEGYSVFGRILKDTAREEGEVYLLVSREELPESTIQDETATHVQELYRERREFEERRRRRRF